MELNKSVASRFLARNPMIVRICYVVDCFPRKSFWFFQSFLFNFWFDAVELQSIIYAAKEEKVIHRKFLVIPMSLFLRKRRFQPFVYLSIVFGIYTTLQYRNWRSSNFLVFRISGSISSKSTNVFNFSLYYVKFFWSKLSKIDVYLVINNIHDSIITNLRKVSNQILEMFFPHLYSLFLAGSF